MRQEKIWVKTVEKLRGKPIAQIRLYMEANGYEESDIKEMIEDVQYENR